MFHKKVMSCLIMVLFFAQIPLGGTPYNQEKNNTIALQRALALVTEFMRVETCNQMIAWSKNFKEKILDTSQSTDILHNMSELVEQYQCYDLARILQEPFVFLKNFENYIAKEQQAKLVEKNSFVLFTWLLYEEPRFFIMFKSYDVATVLLQQCLRSKQQEQDDEYKYDWRMHVQELYARHRGFAHKVFDKLLGAAQQKREFRSCMVDLFKIYDELIAKQRKTQCIKKF